MHPSKSSGIDHLHRLRITHPHVIEQPSGISRAPASPG
jgi:hypothetical protein